MSDNFKVGPDLPPSTIAGSSAQVASSPPANWADPVYLRKGGAISDGERDGAPHLNAVDLWPFIEALGLRWRWLAIGGAGMGLFGFLCGLVFWKSSYTAPVQLVRYDSPSAAEVFGFRPAAPQTFASLLRSPDLLRRVAAKAHPPISADALVDALRVMPERNSDIIVAAVSGRDAKADVDLANLY